MFYNPNKLMRDLRWIRTARGWKWLTAATVVVACGLLAIPSVRRELASATGAALGGEASQAASQAPESFIQQARRALATGRAAEAETLAKSRPAGDADAAAVLALVEETRGKYDEALALLEPASKLNPSGEAALQLGLLLQQHYGRADAAAEHLNRVMGRGFQAPDTETMFRAGRAAQALGRMQDANALYRAAARSADPSIEIAWGGSSSRPSTWRKR